MQKRDKTPIWKQRYSSINALENSGDDMKLLCGNCYSAFKVDLNLLGLAYGGDADIRGRRFACPSYGCKGTTTLLIFNGVFRAL